MCHLIDKNKMNINDIKLSEITDQYIEYINKMEEMNLEVTSEFLVMASTLIYLKSKSLLPSDNEESEEISEEELLRRIIEYKKYKEITKDIKTTVDNLLDIAGNLSDIIHNASPNKQNKLLKLLIKDCTLHDKKLKYTVRAPFDKFIKCNKLICLHCTVCHRNSIMIQREYFKSIKKIDKKTLKILRL